MLQLAEDLPGVSLAVSLHAPTQELRQTIVPSAKAYPLQKLMTTLDSYLDKQDQKSPKVELITPQLYQNSVLPLLMLRRQGFHTVLTCILDHQVWVLHWLAFDLRANTLQQTARDLLFE